MITYHIHDIKPVAQGVADSLAGDWFIINNYQPYEVVERAGEDQDKAWLDEREKLQILEDNIRNGDKLHE